MLPCMSTVVDRTAPGEGVPRFQAESRSALSRRAVLGAVSSARPQLDRAGALRFFERKSAPRAVWQVANSLVPYLAMLALMVVTVRQAMPWWTTLALAVPASGFMVRLFILMGTGLAAFDPGPCDLPSSPKT
jgi:hypothetical protein